MWRSSRAHLVLLSLLEVGLVENVEDAELTPLVHNLLPELVLKNRLLSVFEEAAHLDVSDKDVISHVLGVLHRHLLSSYTQQTSQVNDEQAK